MSEENKEQEEILENTTEEITQESENDSVETKEPTAEEKIIELNDKYLRLYSEFDNYRKRTSKERIELFKTAGQDIMTDLVPIMDDFERALQNMDKKEFEAKQFADFKDQFQWFLGFGIFFLFLEIFLLEKE